MLQPHVPHFEIRVDGSDLPRPAMDGVLECTVENSLHLPDVCTIRVDDADFKWLDAQLFREGKKLEVSGAEEKTQFQALFVGEITGMELDLSAHGVPTVTVRAYSREHRLTRGRKRRSFVQVKDSDIVQKVGQEAGFSVSADSTSQVHDWVFQNNQTDWEFLSMLAARDGRRLYLKGERELCFKKITQQPEKTIKLEWGTTLRSFRPRTSAVPQVDEVIVRGWDPKQKQPIIGKCTSPDGTPDLHEDAKGGAIAKKAYGSAQMVVVDRPLESQSEAEDLAKSVCDHIAGAYLEADGLCYSQPSLKPGCCVEIPNIGKRFSGTYFVTSTTHTYTPAEGYVTQFSVTGKRPATLLSLLDHDKLVDRAPLGGNIVIGLVTNTQDPDNLGRIKVKYPWMTDEHESFWVRIATPMAGPDRGFEFLPEIGDEVLVAFEHGDIHRPYMIGALWNGKDKPVEPNSKAAPGGKIERRTIKTRIGHFVLLDDTDGKGEMSLTTANGHHFVLDDAKQNITALTKSGHKVLLDDQGKQIVVVDSSGGNKITINTNDNSMKLECMGDFAVNAKGKVTIEGTAGVEVKTPAQVKVEGTAGVDVKTTAMMNLEATGPATLKSSAITTVQGTLVKIN